MKPSPTLTFRCHSPTPGQVSLVGHQNNRLLCNILRCPQSLEDTLRQVEGAAVGRRVNHAVPVRVIGGQTVLRLKGSDGLRVRPETLRFVPLCTHRHLCRGMVNEYQIRLLAAQEDRHGLLTRLVIYSGFGEDEGQYCKLIECF